MDASENDVRNQTRTYGVNNQQGYSTSIRLKVPARNAVMQSRVTDQYANVSNEEDEDEDGDETGEEVGKVNGVRMIGKDSYDDEDEDEGEDDDDEDEDEVSDDVEEEDDGDGDNDNNGDGKQYNGEMGNIGIERPQKKRKLKDLVSNYEFVPRVRAPSAHVDVKSEPLFVGRDERATWNDRDTFVLLDAWGDLFLKLGRKSLCSEEWQEVADKVAQETNIERTVSQCRNRLDVLKKKYKKEKTRSTSSGGSVGKWVFFKKMDMLLCSPSQRPGSLSCGIDSGEYVFTNPKVYLNHANGVDEMRDSPDNSEASKDDKDDSGGKRKKGRISNGSSFQLLANSIQKFSEIYEDIEISKRKQMVDLENMRMDFQRQIEIQMREILERAQAEIVKIRQDGDDENELMTENRGL
ncbi:hypothetical protein KSS87_013992 [Heliosperma pusillum]|nr:hypothetical protein KSS87_013992 [Heliosperma pusillum]